MIVITPTPKKNLLADTTKPALPVDIHGRVTDSAGNPLIGATVQVKGTNKSVTTDNEGFFIFKGIAPFGILVVSYVGYEPRELKIHGLTDFSMIHLKHKIAQLDDVTVEYSNGYQKMSPERATGSFDVIDNKLFNRSVSTDVISRMEGVTSGLLFNEHCYY